MANLICALYDQKWCLYRGIYFNGINYKWIIGSLCLAETVKDTKTAS